MTNAPRKKPLASFARAVTGSVKPLVAAKRTAALPAVALLQVLLAACARRGEDLPIQRDDPATNAKTSSAVTVTRETARPTGSTSADEPATPKAGVATTIEETVTLEAPPPPPPPPKPVLGKPHGIKPPKDPHPLGGDYILVIPRPIGTAKAV